MGYIVRSVSSFQDIEFICAIYGVYVESSTATWAYAPEELPKPLEYEAKWLAAQARSLPWLVAVSDNEEGCKDGEVIGYCTVGEFRGRAGWRNTCEHGIYVAQGWQKRGVGKALLTAALEGCKSAGVACLVAVISVHPPTGAGLASRNLHLSLGFERAGYLTGAGLKLGKVLDCEFLAKYLVPLQPSEEKIEQ